MNLSLILFRSLFGMLALVPRLAGAGVDPPLAPPPLTDAQISETVDPARHGRAVSLRVLQQLWQRCAPAGNCPPAVVRFADLRWVTGYIVDQERNDVIVLGRVDAPLPPLFTEDFAVALRNALFLYAERRGNTVLYTAPGVSIDADPQVMGKLSRIKLQRAPGQASTSGLTEWQRTCTAPMKVRVLGVPFHSRFADIAVRSDYAAKSLLDGKDRLQIEGFDSLLDRRWSVALASLKAGGGPASPVAGMNRIWFAAPELQLLENQGSVLIGSTFQVTVQTEAEVLGRDGGIVGTGGEDPMVKRWTDDFTRAFRDISKRRPLFSELEGLFRWVALAKALTAKRAFESADLAHVVLSREVPIPRVVVNSEVKGCFNYKQYTETTQTASGAEWRQLVMPTCGGVGMTVEARPRNFTPDRSGVLQRIGLQARDARRDAGALFWDY